MLGILGGMGPLASAEFVRTLYESHPAEQEQDRPACILYSDPSVPDRTEAILTDTPAPVVTFLETALDRLANPDIGRIVIACITAHHFLPDLRPDLRDRVVSLVDLIVEAVADAREPHLLFCTNGTRRVGIFEQHPRWTEVEPWVVLPSDDDQTAIHDLLYRIKQGADLAGPVEEVERLLTSYGVRGLIAGCTEMHLITKRLVAMRDENGERYRIADPLLTIAQRAPELLAQD